MSWEFISCVSFSPLYNMWIYMQCMQVCSVNVSHMKLMWSLCQWKSSSIYISRSTNVNLCDKSYDHKHTSKLGPNFTRWFCQSIGSTCPKFGQNVPLTLHNQCAKFHNFLQDSSMGYHRYPSQKKKMKQKKQQKNKNKKR